MRDQVAGEGFYHRIVQGGVHAGVGAPAPVHGHHHQRFVQRHNGVSHPPDAARFPQSLGEGAAQRDGGVLDQVVPADVGIAPGLQVNVKEAVPGQLADHMVQEAVAGVDAVIAPPVQVDGDGDVRFAGGALEGGGARRCFRRGRGHYRIAP